MNIKYIVLRTEVWIRNLFKNKLVWIFSPIIIGLWLNIFILSYYIRFYNEETFTVDINHYGEKNIEIILLIITLIIQIYSFIMILIWRWKFGRLAYNVNIENKRGK